jgi:uncharacterized repeat protein (TIGR02543 family)
VDGHVTIYSCEASNFAAFGPYTVTFEPDNGDAAIPVPVSDGNTVTAPNPAPTKSGYTFAGWYTSNDGGQTLSATAFDFNTPITADITLYAKWEENNG